MEWKCINHERSQPTESTKILYSQIIKCWCTSNQSPVNAFRNTSFSKGQTTNYKRCEGPLWSALVALDVHKWNGTLKLTPADQTFRWGGWCWRSPPAGWTCVSGSCFCWGSTAESRRSLHCWPMKGAFAASGPQQSTGSPSSCAISSWSPTAPSGRNFTRSFLMYFKLYQLNEKVQYT